VERPLEGVRVLDLSRVLSGPYCTMILADQGADVVKIERPDTGDDARHLGPPYVGEDSGFFVSINRNKRSLALDLKTPDGLKLLHRLAESADVFVENFRPGVAERLGCGYSKVSSINPRIIYCSVSGFGQTGPYRERPGYNMTVQALGGAMTLTGAKGAVPSPVGIPVGDIPAGIYAATAIAMALYQREKTGVGRWIDVSLFDALLSMIEFPIIRHGLTGEEPGPVGDRHPSITPYGIFRAQDASIVLAVGSDALWTTFCQVLVREDLREDPRFVTNAERTRNVDPLREEIERTLRERTAAEWIHAMVSAGIPASPVNHVSDVYRDPQALERGMLAQLVQPGFGDVTVAGTPIRWGDDDDARLEAAPRLGEHTADVLREWLGLSDETIRSLAARGAIEGA